MRILHSVVEGFRNKIENILKQVKETIKLLEYILLGL